jgi:hypothetical protein
LFFRAQKYGTTPERKSLKALKVVPYGFVSYFYSK